VYGSSGVDRWEVISAGTGLGRAVPGNLTGNGAGTKNQRPTLHRGGGGVRSKKQKKKKNGFAGSNPLIRGGGCWGGGRVGLATGRCFFVDFLISR